MASKATLDGWHFTKTLLACPPSLDINQRHLYFGLVKVATFNRSMLTWDDRNDTELEILCEFLNENFKRSTNEHNADDGCIRESR